MATKQTEPDVVADDGAVMSYSEARVAWENGDFSAWVETHGFPLMIDGVKYPTWESCVEEALSDDTWDQ